MEKIALEKLSPCPIRVTIHTEKMIAQMAMTAKADLESIPPISVADLNGECYIVDGHARVEGCRKAGVKELPARIKRVERIEHVILWHIRLNRHTSFNPLVLFQVFKDEGISEEEIAGKYWLDLSLVRAVRNVQHFTEEAFKEMSSKIEALAKKYMTVSVPHYIIDVVARAPEDKQLSVIEYAFINMNEPEQKFSYRSHDELEYMLSMFEEKEREPSIFDREDRTARDDDNKVRRVPTATKEEAKQIIGTVPHLAFLKCECGKRYVVNRKTLTISPVEEKDGFISIKGDRGQLFFALPVHVAEYLELEEGDMVRCYPFSIGSKNMQKILERLKNLDGTKGALVLQEAR